jgi:hypothetical protein
MAGLSRIIAKELSSMLGITDNPKFNPMFKQTDEALEDVSNPDTPTIAEFYSPLESAIENAPIGKQGTRGENIEAFVRKRAPKVTQGELEYREFSLDPARKYTRGDNSGVIDDGMEPLNIQAVKKKTSNQSMQRQDDLLDSEVGYEEIGVDVKGKDLGLETHYGSSNLAHARYSLRQNIPRSKDDTFNEPRFDEVPDYILIEELQSDSIQNMVANRSEAMNKTMKNFKVDYDEMMDDVASKREFEMAGSFFEDYEDFLFNRYMPIALNEKLSKSQRSLAFSNIIEDVVPELNFDFPENMITSEVFETMMFKKLNISEFDEIFDVLGFIKSNVADLKSESKMITVKKDTPLTSLTDSVRVLLQSVIADAKAKGIDEIVLPPIEKLAEKRFGTSGGKTYRKAITKGSGFHNTYVVAFDKALKQLQAELGNQIKVGTKDLKYKPILGWQDRTMAERFPRGAIAKRVAKADAEDFVILKGKSINIKDLKLDPNKVKLRFNKGGLVKGLMSR